MKEKEFLTTELQPGYGFINTSEDEKLWNEWSRPFVDKVQSFTLMLRRKKDLDKLFNSTDNVYGRNG